MRIVTIIGARPQFVKAAVVSKALRSSGVDEVIIHTGQHYDPKMSHVFFNQMKIPVPDYTLDINGLTHGAMTGRMLEQIEGVLLGLKADFVLVYGDTNSTLAGALAAKKLHIPLVHVEAGLRSFNSQMPEEINRIVTDRISDYLFCPTAAAVENLNREGFQYFAARIVNVGDVMYDCFLEYSGLQQKPQGVKISGPFILATIHRAENTSSKTVLTKIINFLNQLSNHYQVVLPLHPRTAKLIAEYGLKSKFLVCEPVGYLEMLWLLNNATLVVTDSGGLQKEAYFARKKCYTLRSETEWVELVTNGWNQLVNPRLEIDASSLNLAVPEQYVQYYGNGNASKLIVDELVKQ